MIDYLRFSQTMRADCLFGPGRPSYGLDINVRKSLQTSFPNTGDTAPTTVSAGCAAGNPLDVAHHNPPDALRIAAARSRRHEEVVAAGSDADVVHNLPGRDTHPRRTSALTKAASAAHSSTRNRTKLARHPHTAAAAAAGANYRRNNSPLSHVPAAAHDAQHHHRRRGWRRSPWRRGSRSGCATTANPPACHAHHRRARTRPQLRASSASRPLDRCPGRGFCGSGPTRTTAGGRAGCGKVSPGPICALSQTFRAGSQSARRALPGDGRHAVRR